MTSSSLTSTSEPHHILSPATGRELETVGSASAGMVSEAVSKAMETQPAWAARRSVERADVLERAAAFVQTEASRLSRLLAEESGKILAQEQFELNLTAFITKGNAQEIRFNGGDLLPAEGWESTADDVAWVRRVQLGVVAAVLPVNFPVELFAEKVPAALAMGNAVVLKPPEQDPLTVMAVREVFVRAGVPAEVLAVLPSGRETGVTLCSDARLAAVSMTGSTRAGAEVAYAPILRKLHSELGGNDGAIPLRGC